MTRKHFTMLAEALRFVASDDRTDAATMAAVVDEVARVCKAANPNFDHARFVAAVNA